MARLSPPAPEQSTAIPVPPSPVASKYTGEPISVNLKDVDLKDFFRLIHEISGLNIVLDPNVKGTVTLVLDDVPWDQALDIVLKNNALDRELQGNVLRIAATDTLRREAVDRRAQSEAVALAVDRQTITRFLSYAKAREVVPTIKKFLTARGDVISDERTNALIISDIPSVLPNLDRLISQLDKKSQEVEIEVRVVSATRSFTRDLGFQLGFNWGNGVTTIGGSNPNRSTLTSVTTAPRASPAPCLFSRTFRQPEPTTGFSFSNITASYGIDAILTAAETHNLAKVLSRPRVVTQSNVKAEVKQGVKTSRVHRWHGQCQCQRFLSRCGPAPFGHSADHRGQHDLFDRGCGEHAARGAAHGNGNFDPDDPAGHHPGAGHRWRHGRDRRRHPDDQHGQHHADARCWAIFRGSAICSRSARFRRRPMN